MRGTYAQPWMYPPCQPWMAPKTSDHHTVTNFMARAAPEHPEVTYTRNPRARSCIGKVGITPVTMDSSTRPSSSLGHNNLTEDRHWPGGCSNIMTLHCHSSCRVLHAGREQEDGRFLEGLRSGRQDHLGSNGIHDFRS